jgi:hypothetical protein
VDLDLKTQAHEESRPALFALTLNLNPILYLQALEQALGTTEGDTDQEDQSKEGQ